MNTDLFLNERNSTIMRKAIVDRFLERFIPSEEELSLLISNTSTLNKDFFKALTHLQEMNEDCKSLLMSENQQAG
jgi:conserved oligomeric Golgi complex subunit 6